MTITLTIDAVAGTATFSGLTPSDIGAVSVSVTNALNVRITSLESIEGNQDLQISNNTASIESINTQLLNLSSSSVKLSNIAQDVDSGVINLNANTFVDGQLTAFAKLETRLSEHGLNIQPWSEEIKQSCRFDLWSSDTSKEFELSLFKDSYTESYQCGLGIYKPDGYGTLNTYIAGVGNTLLAINNGYVGLRTYSPRELFDVVGGNIRCDQSIKLGTNGNAVGYSNAVPTTGEYIKGDILFNTNPSAGGNVGWVCVVAGTPGTWKSYGTISV